MKGPVPDETSGPVVGRVIFDDSGTTREAILQADGTWTCDEAPSFAEILRIECPPGPGPPGRDLLIRAARRLQGMAWLGPARVGGPAGGPTEEVD